MNEPLPQCPRCKKYDERWTHHHTLQQHLRFCTGPTLFDQFDVGRENNKRLRSEISTTQPTGNQMLRLFDIETHTAHSSGLDRAVNPLAYMPSLGELAAPWNAGDDGYDFFGTGGFDDDYEADADPAADNSADQDQNPDAEQNETEADVVAPSEHITVETRVVNGEEVNIEKSQFLSNVGNMPRSIVYQLHLMHVLNSHRRIDLNLFGEINDCVTYHAREKGVKFESDKFFSRDELVRISTEVYGLHGMKPKMNRVKLSDGGEAVVPTFDVKTMLLSILNDKSKMIIDNIAPNYHLFSGRPIDPSTDLGEIHTGWAWEEARAHHCGDQENILPLGLVCFYDKTHSDLFGSLACAPFIAVPTFFNIDCRCNTDFWVTLGYVPNLGYGKGKANQQESREKLQDQHNCLKVITDQIAELRDKGYFWTEVMGKVVKVVVWVHIITGDTSGHNELCQKYNSNGNTACPYRCCRCNMSNLSNSYATCELVTMELFEEYQREGRLSELSMHDINNAFADVPISDIVRGIFGIVPAETLHVLGTGIIKYIFKAIVQLIGPNQSKMREKDLFDTLHENLVRDAARQSERDFPRITIPRGGFGDGTKMTGGEAFGNLLIQLCVSYTDSGIALLKDGMTTKRISQRDYRHCIKLLLAFDRWCNQTNPRDEVESAFPVLEELIDLIKRCFPRDDGNGWNIPKIHSLAKMIYYMLKFGSAKGISGQTGERALKEIVKDLSEQTQRRPNVYCEQVATRNYEYQVLEYAFRDLVPKLGLDWDLVHNTDFDRLDGSGKFSMTFLACDRYERGNTRVTWLERSKNQLEIGVSRKFRYAIRKFACDNGWMGQFEVEGYTRFSMCTPELDEPVHFHATEYLIGGAWYDHAMIQYGADDEDQADTVCPARVYGFFRYTSPGVPTPHLVEEEGLTQETIEERFASDDNIYAVIHAASDYLPWSKLDEEFVCPFKFGASEDCLQIVKVKSIISPLFAFANYGGKGAANKDKWFCVLPRRRWAQYFSRSIYSR